MQVKYTQFIVYLVMMICATAGATLPSEYIQLPYIKVNDKCQIKTGYTPLATDRIEMTYSPTQTNSNEGLWCARSGGGASRAFAALQYKDYTVKQARLYFYFNGTTIKTDKPVDGDYTVTSTTPFVIGQKYFIIADGNARTCAITNMYTGAETLNVSWTEKISNSFTVGSEICLFATHTSVAATPNDNYAKHAFYAFKVYDKDGVLKVDLVPAKRNSDGVVGLYDAARGLFLENTTGTNGSLSDKPIDKRFSANATLDMDDVFNTVTIDEGATLTLAGHALTASALAGSGAIADNKLPDLTEPDPNGTRVTSDPATFTGFTSYTAKALFNNNFIRQENPDHRLIVNEASLPLKIDYDFGDGSPAVVNAYKIYYETYTPLRAPKAWRFYGKKTKDDNTWTLLDERADEIDWETKETRMYLFANTTAYRYYRIEFLEQAGAADDGAKRLELIQLEYLFIGEDVGEVCLDIPEGAVLTNATVGLHGDFRLIKKGAGAFVAAKSDQTYTCGTELRDGTIDVDPVTAAYSAAYQATPFGGWNKVDVSARLDVSGLMHRVFNLKNGATLDLTGCTAAFDAEDLTFDAGAAVTVDLDGRALTTGERLLVWSGKPDNVSFSFDTATAAGITPIQTDTGLFYGASDTVAETASWTGAAGDGDAHNAANWTCRNANGEVIEGALPSANSIVYLSGNANGELSLVIPAGQTLSAARCIVSDCTLTADCDLRAFGTLEIADGCTLDVNGHRLDVAGLAGSGTIADTNLSLGNDLTEPDTDGTRVTSNPATFVGFESYSAKVLFNNNFTYASNPNQRLIVRPDSLPLKIDYDFREGTPSVVNAYKIYFRGYVPTRAPKSWAFYGSNTKSDDSNDWMLLDERTDETDWGNPETRTYLFPNTTPYRYYRIEFKEQNGKHTSDDRKYLEFYQLEYFHVAEAAGELHLHVPEGEIQRNETVAFDGNLKVVKEGKGTFVAAKQDQTYLGGTEILDGHVALFDRNWHRLLGPQNATVTVAPDATVCLNNQVHYYDFICAGGTLANIVADLPGGYAGLKSMTLTEDSTLNLPYSFNLIRNGFAPTFVDLGGHTLDVTVEGTFRVANCTLSDGTVRVVSDTGSGVVYFREPASDAATADFDLSCAIDMDVGVTVRDLTLRAGSSVRGGVSGMNVLGRFKTETANFPSVNLEDGSVLDLSGNDAPLALTSGVDGYGITFADEATVKIMLGDRFVSSSEPIVSWTTEPENLDGLTFKSADGETFSIRKGSDGLYIQRGLIITFR